MIDHVFFETVYENGECIELAAVRTDRKQKHYAAYSESIKSKHFEGVPLEDAIVDMKSKILNPKYDENYVVVSYQFTKKHTMFREVFTQSWLHLTNLAWPLVFGGLVSSLSLDSLSKYHGVTNQAPKTAKGNVVAILETYWHMMRRYKTAMTVEERARDFGGDVLEDLRKVFGF